MRIPPISNQWQRAARLPLDWATSAPVMLVAGTNFIVWDETETIGRASNAALLALLLVIKSYQVLANKSPSIPWGAMTIGRIVPTTSILAKGILEYGLEMPREFWQKAGLMLCLSMANATKWRMVHKNTETERNPLLNPDTYSVLGALPLVISNPLSLPVVIAAGARLFWTSSNENSMPITVKNYLEKHVTSRRLMSVFFTALAIKQGLAGDWKEAVGYGIWALGYNCYEPIRNAAVVSDWKNLAPKI